MLSPMKVAISAGEVSGDEHASSLVVALRNIKPDVEFRGMGGRHLRAAKVDTIIDSEKSASVMGFQELLGSLSQIRGAFNEMTKLLGNWKPNALIVIDYPDFNLRLASQAKCLGIPVFYFISPKVWAWRSGRVNKIKSLIDRMAVIFPFEEKFFKDRGYESVKFVGHPFQTSLTNFKNENFSRSEFLESIGLIDTEPVLAILPGSRKSELKTHLAPIAQAWELLAKKFSQVQAIIPIAPGIESSQIKAAFCDYPNVKIISGQSLQTLAAADAGLLKSGTSNLQAAFLELPIAMFYRTSPLAAWIVRRLAKVKEYSLVNVIKPGSIREIIQEEVKPQVLAAEMERLLFDEAYRSSLSKNLKEVVAELGPPKNRADTESAYVHAARYFIEYLDKNSR